MATRFNCEGNSSRQTYDLTVTQEGRVMFKDLSANKYQRTQEIAQTFYLSHHFLINKSDEIRNQIT